MAHNEYLPGLKPKRIGALIDAGNEYLQKKDALARAKKHLEDAELVVRAEMKKAKVGKDYCFGNIVIHLGDPKTPIKVARRAEPPPVERVFPERPGQSDVAPSGPAATKQRRLRGQGDLSLIPGRRPRKSPAIVETGANA